MAPQQPADLEAYDRKLRPIYEAIHVGNHKGAIKLVNAALSKYRGNQLLRALKAHALDRGGRTPEALVLCDEVRKEAPTEEHVLHTLRLVYFRAGRIPEVTALYQAAAAAAPHEPKLQEGVFAAHVREADLVKQQQVAMRLAKAAGSREGGKRYMWWAVTSLLLQAGAAAAGQASAMAPLQLLQLADTLARRHAATGYSAEALLLHVEVLRRQGRLAEAADLVAFAGETAIPLSGDRRSLHASLLAEAGRLQEAAALHREALQENPDDWGSLLAYLDCRLPSSAAGRPSPPAGASVELLTESTSALSTSDRPVAGGIEAVLQEADALVAELAGRGESAGLRGPVLAAVELQQRRLRLAAESSGNAPPSHAQPLAEAIRDAFPRLGGFVSCATDLRSYTTVVTGDARQWLAAQLHEACGTAAPDAAPAEQASALRQRVAAWQIEQDLGLPELADAAAAEAHAGVLLSAYAAAAPLADGLDPRDGGPGDALVGLAADALLAPRAAAPDRAAVLRAMLQAVLVLEAGCQRRTVAAPMRLRAAALYGLLGAPGPAVATFHELAVRNIQHDTITGHILLPAVLGLGSERAASLLQAMTDLHDHHERDAWESIFTAYEAGTYSKVLEFVAFGQRLGRSHTRAVAAAEAALSKLRRAAVDAAPAASPTGTQLAALSAVGLMARQEADTGAGEGMRFNEDLSLRPPWLPPSGAPPRLALADWWDRHSPAALATVALAAASPADATAAAASGAAAGSAAGPAAGAAGATTAAGEAAEHRRCWWQVTSAAEKPAAAPLRQAQRAALRGRQLLPQLVAAAISGQAAAVTAGGEHVLAAARQLAELHGVSSPDALVAAVRDAAGSGSGDTVSHSGAAQAAAGTNGAMSGSTAAGADRSAAAAAAGSSNGTAQPRLCRLLGLLSAAIFMADDVARRLHGDAPSDESAKETAARRAEAARQFPGCLAALQVVLCATCEALAQRLGPTAGQLADGGALAAAHSLVTEDAAWLRLALQGWAARSKAASKKAAKKSAKKAAAAAATASTPADGAANGAAAAEAAAATDVATQLAEFRDIAVGALASLEAVVRERLAQPLREQVAAVAELAGMQSAEPHDGPTAATLWGWEPRLQARDVLQALVKSQRDVLHTIAKETAARVSSLSAIAM